jgi:DNA mismatch repair protein MutL
MEFKYENEKELFEATLTAVKDALTEKELIPPAKDSGRADWGTVKPEKSAEKGAEPFEVNRGIPKPSYNAGNYSKSYNILKTLRNQEEKEKKIEDGTDNQSKLLGELSGKAPVKNFAPISDIIKPARPGAGETDSSETADNSKMVSGLKTSSTMEPVIGSDREYSGLADRNANTSDLNTAPQKHIYNTNRVYTTAKPVDDDELPEHLRSAVKNVNGKQLSIFNDEILPEKEKIRYKLIGQLFDTYWLIEYDRNLYIMDQHAAHEKIKYEQLMADFKDKEILSQQLMPPLVITVTYQERETVMEYYDLFMKIGYDIEEFGGNEFKINAVPANLYGISERTLFMEFVDSLMENSGYVSNDIFIRKLSTMACKSAIKGNTHITYQEADNLVKQLFELENPYTCPHGRPTIISMSEAEIEKKFRRIV